MDVMNFPQAQTPPYLSVQTRQFRVFIVQVTDTITSEFAEELLTNLHNSNVIDGDRLELHLSCPGGELEATFHLINSLALMFGANISTFLTSSAYSGAAFLFLLGSQRFIFEESSMLIHTYSGGAFGKSGDLLHDATHNTKRYKKALNKFFSPYLSKKEIKQVMTGKDLYLDAIEMIDRGIATNMLKLSFEPSVGEENDEV